jgi:hypothetical protein
MGLQDLPEVLIKLFKFKYQLQLADYPAAGRSD